MRHHIHTAFIAALVAALITLFLPRPAGVPVSAPTVRESAFDRILRTGEIRCGYMNWPPAVSKDTNTGDMSGIMVDYMNALGEALGLKIIWQEEISLATYLTDLNNHRYDMECSGGWPNALRGKEVEYSTPIFYFPIYAAARADDHRFDGDFSLLNRPEARIVSADGETAERIRRQRFPLSTSVGLPASAQPADMLQNVVTGKADVAFLDYAAILNFNAGSEQKLHRLSNVPLRVIPNNTSFAAGEYRLQQMLNTATNELLYDGVIDSILDKYETEPGTYLRVAPPYLIPAGE